jgi:hypothetical protein
MQKNELVLSWSLHDPEYKNPDLFDFRLIIKIYLDFLMAYNLEPDVMDIVGTGYGKNEIRKFSVGLKNLNNNNYRKLKSVSIYTSESDSKDYAHYWKTMFHVSCSTILGSHCYLGVNIQNIELKDGFFSATVKPVCEVFKPLLGYAYVTTPESGPFAYSMGGIHTPQIDYLTEQQKELSSIWLRYQDLAIQGKLRDLYQLNILSDLHLKHAINGTTLLDLIESDPDEMGSLLILSERNTLWTVAIDNYNQIRKKLFQASMLIAYDEKIVPTIFL